MNGDDLVEWLRAQLDADERVASAAAARFGGAWSVSYYDYEQPDGYADGIDAEDGPVVSSGDVMVPEAEHIACHDPARVLRQVEAHRKILIEHEPTWQTVEWDHDQNSKGEALCCARCQNAEHSEWHPPVGHARGLPEGFITPYVLAPCVTLRLLGLIYSDAPGYREEWKP